MEFSKEGLLEYYTNNYQGSKASFCAFYLRGLCLFTETECKFAHSVKTLEFPEISLNELAKAKIMFHTDELPQDNNSIILIRFKQKRMDKILMGKERIYHTLIDLQKKYYSEGLIKEIYSDAIINSDLKVRKFIRSIMHKNICSELVNNIFNNYKINEIQDTTLNKVFELAGLPTHYIKSYLLDSLEYFTDLVDKKNIIKKTPPFGELDKEFENSILNFIVSDEELYKNLPIMESKVNKYFYSNKNVLTVPLHYYTTKIKKAKLAPLLEEFNSNQLLIDLICQKLEGKCEKEQLEKIKMKEIQIFNGSAEEFKHLAPKLRHKVNALFEESVVGLIKLSNVLNEVQKICQSESLQLGNNMNICKKMVKEYLFENNFLFISLFTADSYIFHIQKFQVNKLKKFIHPACTNTQTILPLKKATVYLMNAMIKNHKACIIDLHKTHGNFTQQDLNNAIDQNKIVVVDDEEKLLLLQEVVSYHKAIGVDLEGYLAKEGMIELIQIGTPDLIFIIDFYTIQVNELFEQRPGVYQKCIQIVKNIMENHKIEKVFHDGRKDSLAIHSFVGACVNNYFDLSALTTFYDHLSIFHSMVAEESKTNADSGSKFDIYLKEIEKLKQPDLNFVFKKFGSSHGINPLKENFKKRFNIYPRSYFLERPVDPAFLVYSAKDVEDLVEVKNNIVEKIQKEFFSSCTHPEYVEILCKQVSRCYAEYACELMSNSK